jgi:hypothetical protein
MMYSHQMLTRQEQEERRRKAQILRKKAAHAKHRKANKGCPPSKEQVAAFVSALQNLPLPPPAPSMIRFLLPRPSVKAIVSFHDRTLSSWYLFTEQWKTSCWFTKAQGDLVKSTIESAIFCNLRVRWQLRKWIFRHRMAETLRRNTDTTDVCTTLPAPEKARVTVFDLPNHKAYYFHYQTLQTLITNSLLYQQYGIANPTFPKNPYTNLPWSRAQIISIMQQISERAAYQSRLPPPLLLEFRNADYSLRTFVRKNRVLLHTQAAVNFFQKKYDRDVQTIYEETVDDMYNEYYTERRPLFGRNSVVEILQSNTLIKEIKEKWDALVIAFWIYENHRILYGPYKSYDDLLDQVRKLHEITYAVVLTRDNALTFLVFETIVHGAHPEDNVIHENAAPQ